MRQNLMNYGKVFTKYPKDPYVKKHFYKLYREYNKSRKVKQKTYKNNLLQELETLHDNNPSLYWKILSNLQEKHTDTNENCITPSMWLKHFQGLNEGKEHFLSRINELEGKLKSLENVKCYNELDFPIPESEIVDAISKIKKNKSPVFLREHGFPVMENTM
ncbi:unnamed protein product [Mytilus edulis]|uniref:Uncharacterized protein n=1 Tax=Mytilus edulis TaxID=6550 RepID=A0A8S3TTJ3_MYTED|nr:unnamed protein product [Mytilus edulis]